MSDHIQGDKVIGDKIGGDKIVHVHQQPTKKLTNTPYKFLTSYDRSDKDIFYGRETVTEEFAGKVSRFKTFIISGASGSGKSSLVNAGIIPRLEDNHYLCLVFSEYAKPLEEFQHYVVQHELLTAEQVSPSLLNILQQLTEHHIVVVFDQFERFFVNVPASLRHQFIQSLAECIKSHLTAAQVNFVFVLRRDFLGQMLEEFEAVLADFATDSTRLNLLPLSLDEAQQAIVEPLAHLETQQLVYDEDFVKEVLLVDLQAQSEDGVYPPHLQVVCNQLYEAACAQGKRVINANLYQSLGGVQAILQHYLDDAIAQIAREPEKKAVVRSILKTMIESGGTRQFVSLADLQRALSDVVVQEVEAFLEQLRLHRVIEEREAQYSLSHEFMVEKVRSWFDEREMARQQALETLQRGMAEWQASGALLNEKQVGMIRQWSDDLLEDEQQLLRDSEQVYEARQRREALQKKAAVTAVIAILILAVVSVFFAISSENAKRDVQEQTKISDAARIDAEKSGQEAKEQATNALVEKLAAQSILAIENPSLSNGYYEQALLLAVQAFTEKNNVTTRSNLLRVLQSQQQHKQFLYGHSSSVNSVAFSPDGKTLASASEDKIIRLYEVATGKIKKTLRGHYAWDVVIGEIKKTLRGHYADVNSVAFSPDGKTLASGNSDYTIRLWDVTTGEIKKTLSGHSGGVNSVAFSPDGKTLASGSIDHTIRLWDVETGKSLGQPFNGYFDPIYTVAFSPDGKTLASGGNGTKIMLWNVLTGQTLKQLFSNYPVFGFVTSVVFSPNGKTLTSGGLNNTIKLWNVAQEHALGQSLNRQTRYSVDSYAFSPDGKILVTKTRDNMIRFWNMATRKTLGKPLNWTPPITGGYIDILSSSIVFSSNGKNLASAALISSNHEIGLLNMTTRQRQFLVGHSNRINSIVFSPDGKILASGSCDKTIKLWDVATTKQIKTLIGHSSCINSIAFSPDGKILASGSSDKTIKLWDVAMMKQAKTLNGHSDSVSSVIFSPNGKFLASQSENNTIKLWSVSTGQTKTLNDERHNSMLGSFAFSPDSQTLVSSRDSHIRLWDTATGQVLDQLSAHSKYISSMAFSPDGKILASGSWDKTIRLWDVATRQALSEPLISGHIGGIVFSPDGKTLVSEGDDTIKLWDVDPESWAKKACAIVNRNFSHKEWQKYMGNRPHEKTCPDLPKDTLGAIELAAQAREHLKNGETQQAKTKFKQAREWDNNVVWGDEEL